MSTDRELLEAAARAAGVELDEPSPWFIYGDKYGFQWLAMDGSSVTRTWNPLADDAQALRLAVKLGLAVVPYPADIAALHNPSGRSWAEMRGSDTYAATRRAIVRAAAAMGEA